MQPKLPDGFAQFVVVVGSNLEMARPPTCAVQAEDGVTGEIAGTLVTSFGVLTEGSELRDTRSIWQGRAGCKEDVEAAKN